MPAVNIFCIFHYCPIGEAAGQSKAIAVVTPSMKGGAAQLFAGDVHRWRVLVTLPGTKSLRRDLSEQLGVVLPVSFYFGHNSAEFWLAPHRIPRFVPLAPGIAVFTSLHRLL